MTEGVKKRRRVSKKTKKSWRKYVDTTDVDKYLDDQRLEERLGTPFATRSDKDLFAVDAVPSDVLNTTEINSKAAYREALRNAEPRCYASLKPHTAVPDPISKRNRVRSREERKTPFIKRIQTTRKLNKQIKLKENSAEHDKLIADIKEKKRPKRGNFNADVWVETSKDLEEVDPEWFTSDTVRHTLANKGVRKRKIPTSLHKKPSAVAAIEAPHPGMSYNPSYEDHQQLLHEVAEKETKLMKKEAHLDRVTTKMFKKVSPETQNNRWLKESSEGLPLNANVKGKNGGAENDDDDDDTIVKSVNPPVKNLKKTLVTRRKQREQKQLAFNLKKQKMDKKKIGDIYKLRFLKKNIQTKDEKLKILREKREKVKAIKSLEPKVLSKMKFEPAEIDFKMGEELSGNLRNADPTGNLLKDRFKSLQQRSIVAPSTRVMKLNKAKVKKFIKADHKITWPPKSH